MNVKRLQNKVAESRIALPATVAYTLCICALAGLFTDGMWVQVGLLGLSGFLMFQLNNANALIRIFSRMVSCSYFILMVMSSFLFGDVANSIVSLLAISFYLLYFDIYQESGAVGRIFYAFAILGTMSLFFVQTLYFVPLIWLLLFTNIMAGSIRMIVSSLMGLSLPYWFFFIYGICTDNFSILPEHFKMLLTFAPIADWSVVEPREVVTVVFVSLLSFVGMIHFRLNNYKDKIRTRMLYEVFSVMNLCLMIFLVLQPDKLGILLSLLIVNTAPVIAHYIALTNTKITNISFVVIVLSALSITFVNIWSVF